MCVSNLRAAVTWKVPLCFFLWLFITCQSVMIAAADTSREDFQNILQNSLEALWTGKQFSPELAQRQQKLKSMLAVGEIRKFELEAMMKEDFLALLDRQKTSRYILKTLPERTNSLFSPYMESKEIKEAMWHAMSSVIKENDPFIINVGTLAPPGTPWLEVANTNLIPNIKKLSAGKILIKLYGAGVMGEDTDVLKKMAKGQLNCCGCTALGFLAACPEASAMLLPGLFKNYEEVDFIFEKFRKRLDETFQKRGYDLWALIDTGNFYLFSTKPVIGLADIKQLKSLTWFGVVETTLYQELGINATPVAVPDVISALSTGLAETYLAPAAWALGMQAYQYTNCYLKPALVYSPAGIIVNINIKDELQKQTGASATFVHNIVEIIVAENYTVEQEWKRQIRSYEAKSLKAFKTKCGIQAITLSAEDQQSLEKAGKGVQQKLTGKVFPKDLIDDVQQALAEYRETH